ncbi:MAG: prefoldin subunit alpha [Candidatus Aenigmarchaeota archaeon]|nr:prefoldin subunit alpha [Candidatus Aenigmarchaeota archaeon]
MEREAQKKYIQLQIMKQQFTSFVEQKSMLDEKTSEVATTISALEKMETISTGDEMWSSVGSGAFVRSDVKDTASILMSVGAGVVVRKPREESITMLQGRLKELIDLDKELLAEMSKLAQQISKLEPEVERLVEQEK